MTIETMLVIGPTLLALAVACVRIDRLDASVRRAEAVILKALT